MMMHVSRGRQQYKWRAAGSPIADACLVPGLGQPHVMATGSLIVPALMIPFEADQPPGINRERSEDKRTLKPSCISIHPIPIATRQ